MEQQGVVDALFYEGYDAVKNLLQRGGNPNEVDDEGNSALHHAVYQNNFKLVELLLHHNAQVDIENRFDVRPFDDAVLNHKFEIVKILLQYKAEVRVYFFNLIDEFKYPENIKMLLYENVNVEHVDDSGYTALHHAVTFNDLNGIRTLISRGADVNKVTGQERCTPLHFVRSTECIKILLRAGAEPNVQDEDGWSPLYLLVMNYVAVDFLIERKEQQEMMEELIRYGANCIEIIDNIQETLNIDASLELRYCLEDVLRFMARKENEIHYLNNDNSRL